jgi:DegV family protein with EDD domain
MGSHGAGRPNAVPPGRRRENAGVTRICVVTDSTAELSSDEIEEFGITVIPLDSVLDGRTYRDRVTVSEQQFLELMESSDSAPKTSLPSTGSILEAYERLGRDGAPIVSVHMTGELTGTYNAARLAGELSSANVTVVDSRFMARAHGFQVLRAAKMAATGKFDVDEIVAQLDRVRAGTTQYLGVTQLKYLVKGGRVSLIKGVLSNLLGIKVLLRMDAGSLVLDSSLLGMKAYERHLHQILKGMTLRLAQVEEIGITHTGIDACTQGLIDLAKEMFAGIPLHVGYASQSISSHAGLGAVSLQFHVRP